MRWRRILLSGLIVLLVLLGVALVACKLYLGSQRVTSQVVSRLQAAYGGPVEVASAEVGMVQGSAVRGVRLFEPGGSNADPWLAVEEVHTDVSLWGILNGTAAPRQVTLKGAALTLRFDRDGNLLTRFPESATAEGKPPDIDLKDARFTLKQEGRPDLALGPVNAELRATDEGVTLSGTAAHPQWGEWKLQGDGTLSPRKGSARLTTARPVHVTQPMLESLPFVPPSTWKHVRLEGDTPATLAFRADGEKGEVHCRLTLEPRNTRVQVTSIDLDADQAHGTVIIDGGVVQLRDVAGRTAGGELATESDMDFRGDVSDLHFDLRAKGLDVAKLPAKWGLPKQLAGKLNGHADLRVQVGEKVVTTGEGEGVIQGAKVAGFEADPIRIRLSRDPEGLRFQQDEAGPSKGSAPGEGGAEGAKPQAALGLLLTTLFQPPAPAARPNYLDVNLTLRDVVLEQLFERLKVPLPFPITGRATLRIKAGIPLDTPEDFKTYRVQGNVDASRLVLANLALEQVRADIVYAEGVLRLDQLRGRVPAADGQTEGVGTFSGTARVGVFPAGDLTARLELVQLPLARLLSLAPGAGGQADGNVSATVTARAPAERLGDPAAWDVTGTATSDLVRAFGWRLVRPTADVRLLNGVARLTNLRGQVEGTAVTGNAELTLTAPYPFKGHLGVGTADLSVLQRLAPELGPAKVTAARLDVGADFDGTLQPAVFHTTGTGSATDLQIQGVQVASLGFKWATADDLLKVTDLRAALYQGEVTGSADLPTRATVAGRFGLRFTGVDLGALTKALPSIPLRLEGRGNGSLDGTIPAPPPGQPRAITTKLDLQAPRLRVQGIPTERLRGNLDYRAGVANYQFQGEALGGTFDLSGRYPPAQPPAPEEGRLRVDGASLARLWEWLGVQNALGPLRGRVSLTIGFRHEGPNLAPVGRGRIVVSRLRWDGTDLAGSILGDAFLSREELRFADLTGTVGEGLFRGQIRLDLKTYERSFFSATLTGVEAARLVAPFPALAGTVEGRTDVTLRGRLGRESGGSGTVVLSRGRVLGLEVADWRIPFDWHAAGAGRGQIDVRDSGAQLGAGRATVQGTFGWGLGTRVDLHVQFTNVDLRHLARAAGDLASYGAGQVTGRLDLTGQDVQSVNDLTGTLTATLRQAQAMEFPVLRQVAPFLAPGQSAATFQTGNLRARLNRGVLRVEQLALTGPLLRLLVEGTVTLQGGRLNLEVTGGTGQIGADANLLRLIGLRLPAVGPVPLALLVEVSSYLSNRVVHLRVTGTIRSPAVQIEPLSILTEAAVRFFLNQANVPFQ